MEGCAGAGALRQAAGPEGSGGLSLGAMALSRDGRNAYVTSDSRGGAIAVYRRAR